MAKVERTVKIEAPVKKIFAYITDPNNGLEFVPGMTDIRNIQGLGVGQTNDWTYKMLGISINGKSEVIDYKQNERYVTKSSGGIVSIWTWTVKSENSGTRLNLLVDYQIPVPVLGGLGERLILRQNEREADLAMATLKDRLEE